MEVTKVNPPNPTAPGQMSTKLLNALQQVLTGNWENPEDAKNDDGSGIGPYLITEPYWIDGTSETGDPSIGGKWLDCMGPGGWFYSQRVMQGYVHRYAHQVFGPNPTIEDYVRLYYGPYQTTSPRATALWEKVKRILDLPPN